MNLTLERRIAFGFALLFLVSLTIAVLAWWSAASHLRAFRAVDVTHRVLTEVEDTLVDLLTIETYARGYLLRGDERWLENYNVGLRRIRTGVSQLQKETSGNSHHQVLLARFEEILNKELEVLAIRVETYRVSGIDGVLETGLNTPGDGRLRVSKLLELLQTIETEEGERLKARSAQAQFAARFTIGAIAITTLLSLVLLIISASVARRGIRLRQEFEEKIQRQNLELEHVNEELKAFSYSISHDLRSPLRGINGWSLALMEDCGSQVDARGQGYLQRIRSETQRMGQLIDDLLKLSRISKSQMTVTRVDVTGLAQTITMRLRESNPGRTVDATIQAGIDAHADAGLIAVLLTNLFENAWKFTAKVPAARIEFFCEEKAGETIFCLRDNGAGFDMAYAGKLFSAFQRLHKLSEFPGTGIGLAIVQRIVHRHGGRIWAEARVNQGAAFFFTLPTKETQVLS